MPGSADRESLSAALGRPATEVAPRLLGAVIGHDTDEGRVQVRLSEVEAYEGGRDPGSHAYRGRTERNAVMFGPPGHLYVYFTYGMHFCCNVVCGREGEASAVLLRAGEVVDGVALATRRRSGRTRDLARGPARLCQALGIDRRHNGVDLGRGALTLVLPPAPAAPATVRTGPRVGLRHGAGTPWRFWLDGDPHVSAYRPATPRRR